MTRSGGTPVGEPTGLGSRWDRLRRRCPWLDHLQRTSDSFTEHYGNHYAAAITYFSVLSLFPLLMITFAVAGFVLAAHPQLLDQLRAAITRAVPGALGQEVNQIVLQAIESRGTIGVLGLLLAVYSGIGWMGSLRDALTVQWGGERQKRSFLRGTADDIGALLGLGLALVVSLGLTTAGSGVGHLVLRWMGLGDTISANVLLRVLTVVFALAANWLVFLWVLARLPRQSVPLGTAARGALAASIGFEALKQAGTLYLKGVTTSPAGTVFGPILGIMVFANLVARLLLYTTAWTVTAQPDTRRAPAPSASVVVRPVVRVRSVPDLGVAAALLGVGVVTGCLLDRLRRR